nr:HEAT repeat domain-containing protein [Myxococcota bacterium]
AQSRHADVRLSAITQLASAPDPTPAIIDALVAALGSEHTDLRLRAAVALARRGNSQGIDVLGAFLRSEDNVDEALESLIGLADRPESAGAAAEVIAARLDDDPDRTANRHALIDALQQIGHPNGAASIVRLLTNVPAGKEGEVEPIVQVATDALRRMVEDRTKKPQRLPDGRTRTRYREDLALAQLGEAAKSPLASVRLAIAKLLGDVDDRAVEDVLARLIADRDPLVRVAAAESLALRAEFVPGATLVVLEAALRGGRRELVLPAALGLAARRRPEAFQPLLLVAKAGEPPEMERALLALGSLGDRRALDHLLPLLDPAPEDEAARALTPAAVEALGRLAPSLQGDEATEIRGRVERIALAGSGPARLRAITGMRYAGELGTLERIASDREARNDVRAHAITELGLAAAATSETVLAELLSDELYEVREAAVTALTTILQGDRTRVSLHALASPHDHISRPAATYLATAGDPATLVARLGKVKSPDLRRMLREGLIRRGALPEPELAAALAGDAAARAEAAWIVGYAGPAAARLADAVVQAVARSAAEVADARSGPSSRSANVEASIEAYWASLWAARRVGASGTVAVEAAATSSLGDDRNTPVHIRQEAAAVLATAGSGSATAALTKVLGDSDREVRAIATATVAARTPQVAPAAVRSLGSRADATTIAPLAWAAWPQLAKEMLADPATRYWALPVSLSGARTAELIAVASSTAAGNTPERLAAIAALGRIGGPDALAALEAIHSNDSEDDAIKLAAWKALRRIARRAGKVYAEGQDKGGKGERSASGGGDEDDGDGDGDGGDDDSGDDDEDGGDDDGGDDDGGDDDDDDGDDDDGDDDDDGGDDDDDEEEDDDE